MSQQPTTPEEDRERTQDEKVINGIRRRRYWIKELKLPLILGLLMALAMLAAFGVNVFNRLRELASDPITSPISVLLSFSMGWFFCGGFLIVGILAGSVIVDNRLQRLLLKYHELTIELEHRLEIQQRTTDKHTT